MEDSFRWRHNCILNEDELFFQGEEILLKLIYTESRIQWIMVPARIGKFLTIGTLDSGTPKDIESSCHSCFLFLSVPLLHVSPHRSVSLCLASCSSFLIRLSTRHVNPSNLTSLILDSSLILESNGERLDYLSLYHVLWRIISGSSLWWEVGIPCLSLGHFLCSLCWGKRTVIRRKNGPQLPPNYSCHSLPHSLVLLSLPRFGLCVLN